MVDEEALERSVKCLQKKVKLQWNGKNDQLLEISCLKKEIDQKEKELEKIREKYDDLGKLSQLNNEKVEKTNKLQ